MNVKSITIKAILKIMISKGFYKTEEDAILDALCHHFHEIVNGHVKTNEEMLAETSKDFQDQLQAMKKEMN